jgi:hypothetical protein
MKHTFLLLALFVSFGASAQSGGSAQVEHSVTNANGAYPTAPRNQDADVSMKLYPTLANKYVNIYVNCKKPKDITINIYDASKTLIKQMHEGAQTSYEKSVDVTGLPNGKYNVFVEFDHGHLRQSFTVAH